VRRTRRNAVEACRRLARAEAAGAPHLADRRGPAGTRCQRSPASHGCALASHSWGTVASGARPPEDCSVGRGSRGEAGSLGLLLNSPRIRLFNHTGPHVDVVHGEMALWFCLGRSGHRLPDPAPSLPLFSGAFGRRWVLPSWRSQQEKPLAHRSDGVVVARGRREGKQRWRTADLAPESSTSTGPRGHSTSRWWRR
jgi:hypothetical protein